MEIVFLGTSCMVPTKERNHQAIYLSYRGDGLLVDCGEGTQRQLKKAGIKPTKISTILITHWHGDHVLGLPGLIQTLNALDYQQTLKIYGPVNSKKYFNHMFQAFSFKINFEYRIQEIKNDVVTLKNLVIKSRELKHSVPCLGFQVAEKDRRRIKQKVINQLGIPEGPLLGKLQNNEKIKWKNKIIKPEDVTYLVKGKKITIILDTLPCENASRLANNADILIAEAVYSNSLLNKAEENMHLSALQAAQLASSSSVKKLIITHFSQRYKSTKPLLDEAKMVFSNTRASFDLMKVKV